MICEGGFPMKNKLKMLALSLARVLILAGIVLVLAIMRPQAFWSMQNLSTVIFQQAPFTILMSFGMTLAIITKGIDKSMGSILVLSSVLSATAIKNGQFAAGILIALAVGFSCGLVNGVLITRVGIAPFVATYGVEWVALGIAYIVTGGAYIYNFPQAFRNALTGTYFLIPNSALIAIAIFAILWFVTRRTVFGRSIYYSGFNFEATMLSGINSRNTVTWVYIINGLLAAVTGLLYMARLNAADPGISGSFTLDSIAATLIGGTSFGGGKGAVTNTVVGALIIVFIRNGLNILAVPTTWQQTAVGLVIMLSIFLEAATNRSSEKTKTSDKPVVAIA